MILHSLEASLNYTYNSIVYCCVKFDFYLFIYYDWKLKHVLIKLSFPGGENIKEIKERSDAAVVVSQNNVRFPGTNERVISIRGSMDAIKICVNMIQEKIR